MVRPRLALLACALGVSVAPAPLAVAESVGGFHFRVPEGWSPCADGRGLCTPGGQARIVVKSPAAGGDAAALARAEVKGKGSIFTDQAAPLAGQPGHLVLAGDMTTVFATVATAAGGGVVVTLIVPHAEANQAVHAWIAVVQGGVVGDPPPAPADATPRPFRLENAASDCTATLWVDGKGHVVEPGKPVDLSLAPGRHVVEWTQRDGTQTNAVVEVPPADRMAGSCATTESADAAVRTRAATPTLSADDPRAVFAGARAAVLFYRTLWNLVLDEPSWPPPKSLDRLMLKLVSHRDLAARPELVPFPGHLATLDAAVARAGKDPAARAKVRRVAALLLLDAGQITVSKKCPPLDAAAPPEQRDAVLDCVLERQSGLGTDGVTAMNAKFPRLALADPPRPELLALLAELAP